jgi:plasmid segregation protein ParM
MKNSEAKVAAIDVGFGNTKWKCMGKQGVFPSLAPNATSNVDLGAGIGQRRDTVVIEVNKNLYEVGKDSELAQDASFGRYLDNEYANSDPYLALLRGALYYMGVPEIDVLVVGLPINTFEKNKESLRQRAVGDHKLPNPKAGQPGQSETITVTVKSATVLPQPMGAYFDFAISTNQYGRMKEQTNLIIDPGFYTLDWLLCSGNTPNAARSGAHSGGMSAVLAAIGEGVSAKLETPITNLMPIDRALRTGKPPRFHGKEEPLDQFMPAAKAKIRQFVAVMANKVGSGVDIDNVILAGGGAQVFLEAIQEKLPRHEIVVLEEPIYANVRGFYLAGVEFMKAKTFAADRAKA